MKKLAVVFPGLGYHADKPLLYYGRNLATEFGFREQIIAEYSYRGANLLEHPEKMQEAFEVMFAQAEEQLSKVEWKEYDDIVFISKSVGTAISCAYAARHQISCRQVLYTPLEQTFLFPVKDAVTFTGTADPWVDHEALMEAIRRAGVPVTVIPEANHSLEIKDAEDRTDTLRNLEILKQVMEETGKFLC